MIENDEKICAVIYFPEHASERQSSGANDFTRSLANLFSFNVTFRQTSAMRNGCIDGRCLQHTLAMSVVDRNSTRGKSDHGTGEL